MAEGITGADLRRARESKRWGLEKLAGQIDLSKGHLSKVERGIDGRKVTDELVQAYTNALRLPGIPIPETTDGDPHPVNTKHTTAPTAADDDTTSTNTNAAPEVTRPATAAEPTSVAEAPDRRPRVAQADPGAMAWDTAPNADRLGSSDDTESAESALQPAQALGHDALASRVGHETDDVASEPYPVTPGDTLAQPGWTGDQSQAMNRRIFLAASGAVAVHTAVPPLPRALRAIEVANAEETVWDLLARTGMAGGRRGLVDGWDETVWEYGFTYLNSPRTQVLTELSTDLAAILHQAGSARGDDRTNARLAAAAAKLAALAAMCCTHLRYGRQARHTWRLARRLSDQSADFETQAWVRGHEITSSIYLARPLPVILHLIEEADAILLHREVACAGAGEFHAGKAQVFAQIGRAAEATATITQGLSCLERLPDQVASTRDSIFGWPEDRIRHADVFVRARISPAADDAVFDRALALYPTTRIISRTQIELHRAFALVRAGEAQAGVAHASAALAAVPAPQLGQLVFSVANDVLAAVPQPERSHAYVADYHDQLAHAEAA